VATISDGQAQQEIVCSEVLVAMHVPLEFGLGTLRLSLGRHSVADEIDSAAMHVADCVGSAWRSLHATDN
jgi:cysteine sulfinate desulfinase/cysteine desulfurase-like protein